MTTPALYFLAGSSGVGKTTLLKGVAEKFYPTLSAHYFDDMGVPTLAEMARSHGGPEQWQAAATHQWIERIAAQPGLVVLEGQSRPSFVIAAAEAVGLSILHITLIDCSPQARRQRLIARGQPELDTVDMHAWSAYLRGQADALKLEIIDTTTHSPLESTAVLAASIRRFAAAESIEL